MDLMISVKRTKSNEDIMELEVSKYTTLTMSIKRTLTERLSRYI